MLTTSRLTEHHTAGGMSRQLPYLSELQPEMFVEVSPELAAERGLEHLGWATVVTSRSAIEARVLVTDRLTPLRVDGRVVHQVWMPYHWGSTGLVTGDSANDLFGVALDPNVLIQESKVTTCDVRPGRRPRGAELLDFVQGYRTSAGVTRSTGTRVATVGPSAGKRASRGRPGPGVRGARPRRRQPGRQRQPAGGAVDDRSTTACPVRWTTSPATPGYAEHPPRVGFFTDTSVCIGCKACEVACKEWNLVPDDGFDLLGMSYDNTGMLGANSWRHVAFIEQPLERRAPAPALRRAARPARPARTASAEAAAAALRDVAATGAPSSATGRPSGPTSRRRSTGRPSTWGCRASSCPGARTGAEGRQEFRWLMASDVCKHCTHAGCLDVCPTGALFRTEFGTVVVQQDICNGCGYCVSGCPYGVIDRRRGRRPRLEVHAVLRPAARRPRAGLRARPARPNSIQFGELDELRERAEQRVEQLHEQGVTEARLYGRRPGRRRRRRTARSSCCSTSRRCTACRRTRWSRPATCLGCGATPARPPTMLAAAASAFVEGRRRA